MACIHTTFIAMKQMHLQVCLCLLCLLCAPAWGSGRERRAQVLFETTVGNFTISLFNETPRHRDNFIKLVESGYYDGLLFHRIIKDFMVQTGDPDSRTATPGQTLGEGGPDYTLPLELDLPYHYHYRGAVAAARESDDVNPERRSSGSQFYIVWGKTYTAQKLSGIADFIVEKTGGEAEMTPDMSHTYQTQGGTPHLDGQYTVFGEISDGLKIIGQMQKVKTDAHDRPLEDVKIIKATLVK